jgi:hypothetical protein
VFPIIAVVFAIPMMVVLTPAVVTVPVATVVAFSIVARLHPARADIGWAGPVAVMPFIMASIRIPVSAYPDIARTGTRPLNPNDPWGWWPADFNSNENLAEKNSAGQKDQSDQSCSFHASSTSMMIANA